MVDPFDSVESFYKDQQITVYDYLINYLKDRFINRLFVQVVTKLEELLIAQLNGNYTKVSKLIKEIGYDHTEKSLMRTS